MKITKFVHSCLLVEMPAPVNRTALFDPGVMSEAALDVDKLEFLDNIIITHNHPDHMSLPLLKKLVAKFPTVRITTTNEAVKQLAEEGIEAVHEESPGIEFFDSPHEDVQPAFAQPEQIGVHYLDLLTDPGDSHSFSETKAVLALPVQAPWGATLTAARLAITLKPAYVVPVHDWHWSDEARRQSYQQLESIFRDNDITFVPAETGESFTLAV